MYQRPDSYGPEVASAFEEASVVQAYRYRPSYPDEVFDWLDGLIVDQPRHVLDVGCGTGFLARSLVERVDRLDALDRSEAMIEEGRGLPGGQHPRLRWLIGDAEHAALQPPYALIVAGDCLHWFEWSVVMPRFASLLTPRGFLASLTVGHLPPPWQDELRQLISRFSTNKNYREINIYALLEEYGLFQQAGVYRTTPIPCMQSIEDYIESFHGRASFSRERMTQEDAAAFDAELCALVEPYSRDGQLQFAVQAEIVWGKPLKGR